MEAATGTTATAATAKCSTLLPQNSSPESNADAPATTPSSSLSDPLRLDLSKTTFVPEQCIFCRVTLQSFDDSLKHMHQRHGLFIPNRNHLLVDLETLVEYLHLVIFEYHECLRCGTHRATAEAAQMHMREKGHCNFDLDAPKSEFAEFYDFEGTSDRSDLSEDGLKDDGGSGDDDSPETKRPRPTADGDSIILPSGKLVLRKMAAQTSRPGATRIRRCHRSPALLESASDAPDHENLAEASTDESAPSSSLSRRERRDRAIASVQLTQMRAADRSSLVHLSSAEQRSLMATQKRQMDKGQKEERRQEGKVDRKGNKNLYAYWHTETPVYQCG
jgi:pre-60S factor REI1